MRVRLFSVAQRDQSGAAAAAARRWGRETRAARRGRARPSLGVPRVVVRRAARVGRVGHSRAAARCPRGPSRRADRAACRVRPHRPSHRLWGRLLRSDAAAPARGKTRHRHRARLRRPGDRARACDPTRRQARSRANRARGHRLPRDLNAMRILFVGDVVGRSGRNIVNERLPALVRDWRLDCVIVNGENAAGGFGITEPIYHELIDAGADAITLGNHAWDQREALVFIERAPRLIRPINYPAGTPGRGAALLEAKNGARVLVVNALGRIFMDPLDDPFAAIDKELAACPLMDGTDAIVIDMHAEASSEKQGMGFFCDGRASLVVGTHTHVPTADHQVLPGGTAYMTDAGMTGDYDSIIGMQKEEPLHRFTTGIPSGRFEPALGAATLSGVAVETDDATGFATRIAPVRRGGRLSPAVPE